MKTQTAIIKTTPLYQELSDWFIKQGQDLMSYELIAKKIKAIKREKQMPDRADPITLSDVAREVSRCRADLEIRYKTTLYNIKGVGYKITSPQELAMYTAKSFRRTIMSADRTYRLVDIVDRKFIPYAFAQVFSKTEGRIKGLSKHGKKFVETFGGYLKEQKKIESEANSNGKETKKANKNGKAKA